MKVTVQGLADLESSREAIQQLASAAPEAAGVDLFIDIRGEPADLSLVDITELVSAFNRTGIGTGRRTAVLVNDDRFEKAEFFAVSARGRGNDVQAFSSFEEACEWLTFGS